MNKKNKIKAIYKFMYCFFSIILAVSLVYVSIYLFQNYKYNEELSSYTETISPKMDNDSNKGNTEILEDAKKTLYNDLKNKNNDIVAVLSVENFITPVVQTNDNKFYLKKNIDKKYAFYGTPFLDCNNVFNFSDTNNIIYGHNMGDGKCFGYIKKLYSNRNNSSLDLELTTFAKTYKGLLVSCIFTSDINEDDYQRLMQLNFNKDDFSDYLNIINNKSYIQTDENIMTDDKILTLYTCSYNQQDSKFLMIFKLV